MEDKNSKLGKFITLLVTVPAEMLGTLADLVEKLVSAGSVWFEPLKRFLRKESVWGPQEFRVAEKFRVDTSDGAIVKIVGVSDLFLDWFRDDVENGVPEELYPFVLIKPMYDTEIIDIINDIGGSVISSWSSMYCKLATLDQGVRAVFYRPQRVERSGNGEFSYTDRNGKRIIEKISCTKFLFIRDNQWFVLRAIRVYWISMGWYVGVHSIETSRTCFSGSQVFSRNSGVGSLTRRKTEADSNPLSGDFGP